MNAGIAGTTVTEVEEVDLGETPNRRRVVFGVSLKNYSVWEGVPLHLPLVIPVNGMEGRMLREARGHGRRPRWRCSRRDCTSAICLMTHLRATYLTI